jgi:hypothetical protein
VKGVPLRLPELLANVELSSRRASSPSWLDASRSTRLCEGVEILPSGDDRGSVAVASWGGSGRWHDLVGSNSRVRKCSPGVATYFVGLPPFGGTLLTFVIGIRAQIYDSM